jgi:hypothetical protein
MDRGWLKAWIIAALVVAALAVAYESFLRAHGYVTTVQDDADLWSIQYDRVRADPHAVVLLGASRIEYAVDPKLLSKLLGGRTVAMLAVNGNYPLATLRALAEDRKFAGLVVVGIDGRGLSRQHWEMQQPWVAHYRDRWSRARWLHRELATRLQERFVLLRSPFSLANIARRYLAGAGLPFNDYVVLRSDRVGFLDYRRTDIAAIKARRIADLATYYRENPAPDAGIWLRDLDAVSEWVSRIEARGGRVAFFREPVTDEHLALDETNYPRASYWDAYARIAPATMIDFRDEPSFAGLVLPDSSHIDGVDVPRFTAALAEALARRGLVSPRASPPTSPPPMRGRGTWQNRKNDSVASHRHPVSAARESDDRPERSSRGGRRHLS